MISLLHTLISLINVGPTLTVFEKFHPPQKKIHSPLLLILRFFPPSTPHLLELCISFFHKIPPSTFSDLANYAPPPRLFQPPRLLERWEYAVHTFTGRIPFIRLKSLMQEWILGWANKHLRLFKESSRDFRIVIRDFYGSLEICAWGPSTACVRIHHLI